MEGVLYLTDEIVNGLRVKSTSYRRLTNNEIRELISRGWIEPNSIQGDNRTFSCQWADEPDNQMECESGSTRCGVIQAPVNQVCLACFDDEDNLENAGHCRPE